MRAKAEISGVFAAFSSVGLVLVGGGCVAPCSRVLGKRKRWAGWRGPEEKGLVVVRSAHFSVKTPMF
jgi:hypothetical protein